MEANPQLGNRARNLAHLIGEAISEDCDAWDWDGETALVVERDGRTFRVTCEEVKGDEA